MASTILHGDCLELLRQFDDNYFDAANADPPSGIGFMGKSWDKNIILNPKSFNLVERHSFVAFIYKMGCELFRVMKPGAHGTIWALPKTAHWTMTALEFAGFEIRDVITHVFSTGFPKNYDVAKGIESLTLNGKSSNLDFRNMSDNRIGADKKGLGGFSKLVHEQGHRPAQYEVHGAFKLDPKTEAGARWMGWGTALKPAAENWILIRKPLSETSIARNVLKWGVGGINIDVCRPAANDSMSSRKNGSTLNTYNKRDFKNDWQSNDAGRWPANLVFSHTLFCAPDNCADGCPVAELDRQSGYLTSGSRKAGKYSKTKEIYGKFNEDNIQPELVGNSGGASRFFNTFDYDAEDLALFFYTAKPTKRERNAGTAGRPVELAELDNLEVEALEAVERVYNGKSGSASKEPKDVEKRFSTKPAANNHPTVKGKKLISHLLKLTTPPGGKVIDCCAGTATGGVAALECGFDWTGMELDDRYFMIAQKRLEFAALPPEVRDNGQPGQIFIDWLKQI